MWGGLTIETVGGGLGLVEALFRRAGELGIDIRYDSKVERLLGDRPAVRGVVVNGEELAGDAVILAAGGYHANTEARVKYLGQGWDLAKVRGSRYNTGNVIQAALDIGARAHGNWSGCHSVFLDADAADFGDLAVLNQQKNYFTLGIVVKDEAHAAPWHQSVTPATHHWQLEAAPGSVPQIAASCAFRILDDSQICNISVAYCSPQMKALAYVSDEMYVALPDVYAEFESLIESRGDIAAIVATRRLLWRSR